MRPLTSGPSYRLKGRNAGGCFQLITLITYPFLRSSLLIETRLRPRASLLPSSLRQSASARASKQSDKVAAGPGQHEQMPAEMSIPQTFVNEK